MNLSYDGSFPGLLCSVAHALEDGEPPLLQRRRGDDLFAIGDPVATDPAAAEILARRFECVSLSAFQDIKAAWMSEEAIDTALAAFALAVLTASDGAEAERRRTDCGDPNMRIVAAAAQRVRREYHRLLGLLRFDEDPDGRLVAVCRPDHGVLPALAPHFRARFGVRPWLIADLARRWALVHDGASAVRLEPLAEEPERGGGDWTRLWQLYYRSVEIENRRNEALRRRFMPTRYWQYLPELYDGGLGRDRQ